MFHPFCSATAMLVTWIGKMDRLTIWDASPDGPVRTPAESAAKGYSVGTENLN